jgi:hypothetical protein
VGEKMEKIEDLMNLKQICSLYLRYGTKKRINEEAKITDKTISDITQEAFDEYFAKREQSGKTNTA